MEKVGKCVKEGCKNFGKIGYYKKWFCKMCGRRVMVKLI